MRRVYLRARESLWRDENAAQLVEFAVALPLLVMFVVGIFDFSSAFTFKQKLTAIARDAALIAAIDPSSDVQSATAFPLSVLNAYQIVDNYLLVNNINDCGLQGTQPNPPTAPSLTWKFTATGNGCPAPGLTLVVNRGYYFPATGATLPTNCQPQSPGSQVAVIATCVSVQYPYAWRFGRAASLLGFSDTLPAQITAVGVVMNED